MASESAQAAQPSETPATSSSSKARADPRSDLTNLIAKATSEYGHKRYVDAAEIYSQASELQDELNGEMAVENADLLYAYGRCLYKVAVARSDVLGGKVSDAAKTGGSGPSMSKKRKAEDEAGGSGKKAKLEAEGNEQGKMRFEGVEEGDVDDWEDEDDEEEAGAEGGEQEEEDEDDFGNAYEVLDVARVLFEKRIEAATADDSAEDGKVAAVRALKETLADIHDLQAEILLENEQFEGAVKDSRASLKLKEELFEFGDNLVSEAHFKLSLALEFASRTQPKEGAEAEDGAAKSSKEVEPAAEVDEEVRKQAADHMEQAIKSTQARLKKEEDELAALDQASDDARDKRRHLTESKELIAEMQERVSSATDRN